MRLSHLGDVVHALPVYHALRAAHPEAEIAWTCQPESGGLLLGVPGLSRVIPFERRGGLSAWLRLRRLQRAFAPDLVVDAQGNAKSAAAVLCAGRARRAGLHRDDWQEPLFARVLDDPAPPAAGPHAMDRMIGLAAHLGSVGEPRRDPALSEEELAAGRARADALLGDGPQVLLHLGPRSDVRHWPPERSAALAAALLDAGCAVCVLAGPAEDAEGRAVEGMLAGRDGVTHWRGEKSLRDLAALFAGAGARGARLVSGDTGPAHLAASVDLPVVLIAGPRDPARTGPWPLSNHRVVAADRPPDCAPCLSNRCRHSDGPVCMGRIEVARVASAVLAR